MSFKLKTGVTALALSSAMLFAQAGHAALMTYGQDWEGVDPNSGTAISDEGFIIGNINVTTGGQWFAGVGAPNGGPGYSALVTDQGGAAQGGAQLSIYNDYGFPFQNTENNTVQAFVYKDMGSPTLADVGTTWTLAFDGKLGNIELDRSDAWAYISVLKTSDSSFGTIFNSQFDSDVNLTTNWSGGSVGVLITSEMVGELLQIGFASETAEYGDPGPGEGIYPATGVFYDNLCFDNAGGASCAPAVVPVPAAVWLFGSGLLGLVGVARRKIS